MPSDERMRTWEKLCLAVAAISLLAIPALLFFVAALWSAVGLGAIANPEGSSWINHYWDISLRIMVASLALAFLSLLIWLVAAVISDARSE